MKCPSKKLCPFKTFSLEKGMECQRETYPHLIVFCEEVEMKMFVKKAKEK